MSTPPTTLLKPGQPDPKMDRAFRSGSLPALVSFGFHGIDPPAALYIQRDDVLVMEGVSQLTTDILTLNARLLLPVAQQPGQPDQAVGRPGDTPGFVGPGYIQQIQRSMPITTAFLNTNLV